MPTKNIDRTSQTVTPRLQNIGQQEWNNDLDKYQTVERSLIGVSRDISTESDTLRMWSPSQQKFVKRASRNLHDTMNSSKATISDALGGNRLQQMADSFSKPSNAEHTKTEREAKFFKKSTAHSLQKDTQGKHKQE